VSDIQKEYQAVLNSIKKNDFQSAFEALKKGRIAVIHSQGHNFEVYGSQN
jgi:hypothetical protein